ncbi:MAG: hypothetical protein F4069_09970 [Rhodothermaceae bacterium]|nr:hypothetical protein [Rhodothermaceae bacterium]MXW33876.1 hypothetical protein [Rhodothermaceae bacterium]MXZ17892.1 hypothetical protein [Rhodothermaceae bacterium]MYC04805.1 hypothetical protein [Rhodothermaceae bacterium]MYG70316.1 hypothetical protein [Rhodothermaceae bacterium]
MPQVIAHTGNISNRLGYFLKETAVPEIRELTIDYPEPDVYDAIDKHLALVEKTATALGQIETVSDEDDQFFEDLSVELVNALDRVEQSIEMVKSFPEDVPWKQKLCGKLEHLAIRIEDVAETCALATNKGFIKMIKAQIRNLMNESTDG